MRMRKLIQWFLVSSCAVLTLAGCQPSVTNTPVLSPLEWLNAQPFEPAPSEFPDVILRDLPQGFEAEDPYFEMIDLVSGGQVQGTRVVYERRAAGDGSIEENIEVVILGYASLADRTEHLDSLVAEGYRLSLEQYAAGQVVRYQEDFLDGRIWVSGPYLIIVFESTEGRSTLVDAFTEMYLDQPPAPGAGTIVDWLSKQPFELPTEEWPDIPVGTPPTGFYAGEPSFETGELESGETGRMAAVMYYEEGEEGGSLAVYVAFYTFESVEGRMELIDLLVEEEELPEEQYNWRLELRNGGGVAVYGRHQRDEGMVWISGPYLIIVSQGQPEYSEWVPTLADLYLSEYPPE